MGLAGRLTGDGLEGSRGEVNVAVLALGALCSGRAGGQGVNVPHRWARDEH